MSPVRGPRRPPVERVRERLAARAGEAVAARLPHGYQRLGRVVLVRWPDGLRPYFAELAEHLAHLLRAATVLRVTGPVEGPRRTPQVERLYGDGTETEVVEHGVRWRFDAARIMFAAGNRTERLRLGRLVGPEETVVDLFAGIGYFAIPAARIGGATAVYAVDHNPLAIDFLRENARRNGVADRVRVLAGDARSAPVPLRSADRVVLGLLPSAVGFLPRAVELLRPEGGWVHVHLVADARDATASPLRDVDRAIGDSGGRPGPGGGARAVKAYGPGRTHVVVDRWVVPDPSAPRARATSP